MLDSLSSASRDEVVAALSAAVRYLSPHPTENADQMGIDRVILQKVLEEVARRTKTRVNDERGRGYQLRYLSDELSRVVLPKNSSAYAAAAARLGERGDLHPGLYEVTFSEAFDGYCAVPKLMVKQSIHSAQSWQHMNPPDEMASNFDLVSLFARTISSTSRERDFTILVVAARSANRVVVHDAFYLFHDSIDVASARDTFGLLVAFTDVFGSEQMLDGRKLGKLVPYRRFVLSPSARYHAPRIEVRDMRSGVKFKQTFMFRFLDQPQPALDIALAFSVDIAAYAAALKKHAIELPDGLRDATGASG